MEVKNYVPRPIITKSGTLPDDILLEIFVLLPDKSLVRLKSLSKSWHLLISRICVNRSIKPVVGLFFRTCRPSLRSEHLNRSASYISFRYTTDFLRPNIPRGIIIGNYIPLEEDEEEGRPLLYWDDCVSSFGLPFRPDQDELVSCCNGLLLFVDTDFARYYICNPLTRQSVSIPRAPFLQETHFNAALAFDPSRGSTCYKVVRFEWPYSRRYVILDIYSSAEKSWSRHKVQVDPCLGTSARLRDVMYFDGSLFRLSGSWHLMRFDLEEVSFSVIGLPLTSRQCKYLRGCMGVQMGRFMYSNEYSGVVYVWSLEKCVENEVGRWDFKHKINIYDLTSGILINKPRARNDWCNWLGPIAFDPESNVIYMGSSLVILKCNLEDNSLEEVSRVSEYSVDMFIPGWRCPALPYIRWLLPFTKDGDLCDPNFFKFD